MTDMVNFVNAKEEKVWKDMIKIQKLHLLWKNLI